MTRIRLLLALALLGQALAAAPAIATPALTEAAQHPRLAAWLADPFVTSALRGTDLQSVVSSLQSYAGFAGAYPQEGGTYVAYWDGGVPRDVPITSPSGLPVTHIPHATVEPLLARASAEADAISLSELETQIANGDIPSVIQNDVGLRSPGPVQGIGPGGPIQMQKANANGQLGTYVCSASYLFRNPASGVYYLATAGHCLLDETVPSSTEKPDARARWVRLCYADCVNNFLGLGKYVQLNPGEAYPGYHPVAWAEQRGIGKDFGFIEIPASVNGLLRPWLWLWGGPTGFDRPSLGEPLVHYGFGIGLGQAVPTQGRLAVTISSSREGGQGAVGWANGGDSGSAFGTATLGAGTFSGDGATGAITHAVTGIGLPLMWGTDMEAALDTSQTPLGFRPVLVTENETIGASENPRPAPSSSPTASPSPGPSSNPSPSPTPTASASPSPSPSPEPQPSPSASPSPEPSPSAERKVSLRASRSEVDNGQPVRLYGSIAGEARCSDDQVMKVLARDPSRARFRVVDSIRSDESGAFSVTMRPRRTRVYRVVAPASIDCARARSRDLTIRITN